MARSNKPGPSEFERRGVLPFGGFGLERAWEKLRYAMRTERDPEGGADLNAAPDKFGHGGIERVGDENIA